MTNTYDGEDKTAMMEGLYQYIMMSTSIRAGTSESNKSYLSNKLVELPEKWCMPIVDKMHELLIAGNIIHADETTIQVLHEEGRKPR